MTENKYPPHKRFLISYLKIGDKGALRIDLGSDYRMVRVDKVNDLPEATKLLNEFANEKLKEFYDPATQ